LALTFTVIIPTYNASRYIAEALESVLLQKYVNQIVVVDDGSVDNTDVIVSSYNNIIYVKQSNKGPAAARNKGITIANSDFIAFLDADDIWLRDHLANAAEIFVKYPYLNWWASAYAQIDETTNEKKIIGYKYKNQCSVNTINYFDTALKKRIVNSSNVIIRKSVLDDLNGFNEAFNRGEDLDLWFRIALNYPTLGYSPEVTSHYIRRGLTSANKELDLNLAYLRIIYSIDMMLKFDVNVQKKALPLVNNWINRLIKNASILSQRNILIKLFNNTRRILNTCNYTLLIISLVTPKLIIRIIRFLIKFNH
jgi:glycosyltransferase involved in cell wall biosynthesis